MMAESQQYALRWDNYFRQLTSALDKHRRSDEFVDVTLLCDGRKIKAHKVVLSACSSYFNEIFTENPHPHPLIIFKFIKYENLNSIIKFMYQGEVNVQQHDLRSFLQTAQMLAVHGLNTEEKRKSKKSTQEMSDGRLITSLPSGVRVIKVATKNVDTPSSSNKKPKMAFSDDEDYDINDDDDVDVDVDDDGDGDDNEFIAGVIVDQSLEENDDMILRDTHEFYDPLSTSCRSQNTNPASTSRRRTATRMKSEYDILTESYNDQNLITDDTEMTIEMRHVLNPPSAADPDTASCANIGLNKSTGETTGTLQDINLQEFTRMLPFRTISAVQKVEKKLGTPDFALAMTTYLHKLKGVSEDVSSVIRAIFTDNLLDKYNWDGRRDKQALGKLMLFDKTLRVQNVDVPQFNRLQSLLVEMRDEIKSLKSEIIAVKIEIRKQNDDNKLDDEFKDIEKLPLGVVNDLQRFDEEIQENEDKLRQFKQFIARTGGIGPAHFIRAAVRKVFSDELATTYSWKGTSTKPSAEKCFLIQTIKNICHLKFKCTDKDMNAVLQRHFVHAKERLEKRKRPN